MFLNLLLYVMVALRLWTAVVLISTGRQNRLSNLYWLAAAFTTFGIGAAFAPLAGNPLGAVPGSFWLFIGITALSEFFFIQFVAETFYRGRKSPALWIYGAAVALVAVALYGVALSTSADQQHPLVAAAQVLVCMVFAWQGWAGYQAWQGVAKEKAVEDWIKSRYLLVIWYCGVQFVASLSGAVRILGAGGGSGSALGSVTAIVTLLCNIVVVALSYLAWAAPQGFYRWLNRNYKPPVAAGPEMSEEELMQSLMQGKP